MATFTKFAQEIKKKYPEYANVDDAKLAKAFLEKYPEYNDQVTWNPDYTEFERKADMSSTPITSREGKVVPVNTSQLGADRVHVSDILKLEAELDKAEQEADDIRAQKKSIAGYYTPIKIKDGKVKPQEFKTYKFTGDRGQTVEFSGVSEKDAYDQAVASGAITRGKTSEERRQAAGNAAMRTGTPTYRMEWATETAPYSTQAQLNDASLSDKAIAYAKDVFSLPGRSISSMYDYAMNEEQADLGRTSEESTSQGKLMESFITDPVTGAMVFAQPMIAEAGPVIASRMAPSVARMYSKSPTLIRKGIKLATANNVVPTVPTIAALEAGAATGAGALMDETYGGEDVAIDVGTSVALPVLGPVIRKLGKTAAISRIKGLMKQEGVELADASAERIYNEVYKRSGEVITEGTKSRATRAGEKVTEKLVSDLQVGEGVANDLLDEAADDVIGARRAGTITGKEAESRLGKIAEYKKQQQILLDDYASGEMSDDTYKKAMTALINEYSSVPELNQVMQASMSNATKGMDRYSREVAKLPYARGSEEYMDAANALFDKYAGARQIDPDDWSQFVTEREAYGRLVQGGAKPKLPTELTNLRSIPELAKWAYTPERIERAASYGSRIPIQLPTIQRMYMQEEERKRQENK